MGAGVHIGLLVTALGFGFRHGIDWDHIAALTDLTGAQEGARRSMLLATLYAIGHAAVVFALGFAAIVLAARVPESIDSVLQRFVGATLIGLGLYVMVALLRHGRDFRMRSRWMLLAAGLRHGLQRVRGTGDVVVIEHEHVHAVAEVHTHDAILVGNEHGQAQPGNPHSHPHRHVATLRDDPFPGVGSWAAVLIGMLHGIGAETPTQVLLFVTAAGVAGKVGGVLLLVAFIGGLLLANTTVAAVSTFGALHATRNFSVYAATSVITAVFSVFTGAIFVLGFAGALPALLGG
jgi:high-affinity nickel-transport protein